MSVWRWPILVEVPDGDVVDRITILEIKVRRLPSPAREAAGEELDTLSRAWTVTHGPLEAVVGVERLRVVNQKLWEVEDELRVCERDGAFGPAFVALARSVYRLNDERAQLKRAVSESVGSRLVEQKGY